MADLRIADAPEIPTEDITGEEKLPTGGNGNYSISLDSLADYTKTKKDLADNTSVDNKVNVVRQELDARIEDLLNPHQVTKGQIGLGNVDNTADADKPVSNSTQAAIISAVTPKADKTYVDNQLTLKANKADVYTKSETYTKQESSDLVNNSISTALTPVNTSLDLAKRGVVNRYDSSLTYNSGERVVLSNGDIVKSTIDGNVNDPNVDMTGWVNPKAVQDEINNSTVRYADSVSSMLAIANPYTGQAVITRSYVGGLNKGGTKYTYDATRVAENNSITCINGWVKNNTSKLLASQAGCREGDFENTDLLNNLILVASNEGIKEVILDGFYKVGKLEKGITTTPFGDENAWWLLKARSGVTIKGRSWNDGVFVAGGLVASNASEPNTKGYMVFGDYNQTNVENFTIKNFRIDNNGQQNLMPQVVGFGSQALCPNVWFQRGKNIRVQDIHFIDNPGHQTVVLDVGVDTAYVTGCKFTNNGKGLPNNNYIVDHSTIYIRAINYWIQNNEGVFTTLKPSLSTFLELHGVNGHVSGNTSQNYPFPLIRASFFGQSSRNVQVHDNLFNECNYGLNLDGADNSPLYVDVYNNTFNFRPEKPFDGHPQVAIGHTADGGFRAVTPTSTHDIVINVYNNTFNQSPISGDWSKFNEFDNCLWDGGKCTSVNLYKNTFNGFKGGYRINFGNSRAEYIFDDTVKNCGSINTDIKSLVIVQNISEDWTGQVKSIINKSELNNFSYEHLIYFNDDKPPLTGLFENNCDGWILPYSGASPDSSQYFRFEYSVTGVDPNKILYAQGSTVSGKITLPNDQYFYKQNGYVGRWNMYRRFGTIPASPRFFGDIKGDRVDILAPNAGDYASFVCTVSGADVDTVGVWKGYSLVQS